MIHHWNSVAAVEEQAQGVSGMYGSDFSGELIIAEFNLLQPLACRKSISVQKSLCLAEKVGLWVSTGHSICSGETQCYQENKALVPACFKDGFQP